MNSYSHRSLGAGFPLLAGEASSCNSAEVLGRLSLTDPTSETARLSALRALLLLSGAVQSSDAVLSRTTDADLALAREALELLYRSEAASAA